MRMHVRKAGAAVSAVTLVALATACSTPTADAPGAASAAPAAARLAVSYAGGITVLDGRTLDVVGDVASEEFTRLNPFGDGRTVVVTTSAGFRLLDTTVPELTDVVFAAAAAGHVVAHHGTTVLFDDATATSTILDTAAFTGGYAGDGAATTYTADAPHHGVSLVLADGTLLTTVGDASSRTGAAALHRHDDHWDVAASSDQCPGIHGEGTAKDEAVVFGCEDGALLYRGGGFTKLSAPDAYGRMGNAFVTETSPIVLGDYKNDPDAEGYLLGAVTLIDTQAGTHRVVDLPDGVEYTFRDLARGPGDLGYILATDGSIHVLDPSSGQLTTSWPVIDPWEGPADWQDPHPAIKVDGDIAYVTEPSENAVHAVDLTDGTVLASVTLERTPNEIAVALD